MERRDDAATEDARFVNERRIYLYAALGIVLGIALVGSLDKHREIAGAALLAGWLGAVYAIHRLGRVGSKKR